MVTGSTTSRNQSPPQWLCFWPGLLRLWLYGEFSSLMLATGFSILLNLALLSTFVWPQWLGFHFPIVAWSILIVVWVGSWWISSRTVLSPIDAQPAPDERADALFIAAQTEYLRGNWHEAEALIVRQLRSRPKDIEARLLLVSMHLQNDHFDDARSEVETIEKFDASNRWRFELNQIKLRLDATKDEPLDESQPNEAGDSESGESEVILELSTEPDDDESDLEQKSVA